MKIILLIAVLLPLAAYAKPASPSLDPTDLAEVELLTEDVARIKRSGFGSGSGSFDLLSGLKKTLLSGIGSASASLVAGSSSSSLSSGLGHGSSGGSAGHGSSYGSSSGHSYDKPHEDTHFDGWSLKKSILNTLFQAVKAITGGVTAIKGQLIKGSGYLVSGAGKLIASGGDAVTGVGKKIALSAHLIPPKHSAHPLSKLTGILSASSSGLSGLSGSSSSSSSGHGHGHGDASGESFTSYEGPTSYGHDSSHGALSGPSGPSYIPPSKGSHKAPSHNSYGADLDDHHPHSSYVPAGKYGHSSDVSAHHHEPDHHDHYPTGYGKGHANVVEASDVLRQILNQKIPHHADGFPKKVIAQYEIPSDSNPPPFKPIKGAGYLPPSVYGVPAAGPIDSVTHSHSITTSFGAPSGYSKLHVESSEPGLPSSYDIYRSMALKHGGEAKHHHQDEGLPSPRSKAPWAELGHSASGVSYELLPPKHVSSAELRDLTKQLGNGIELQKSLAYEIADPATRQHHKRRADETTDTTTLTDGGSNRPAATTTTTTNT
uniref:hornerin n=1 Tax=Anopheles coluzzii TaxID=1518534 RepID=UPI0020FFCC48|nr:hornerin [Anopheles coluzzii]XP_040232853.2 hornerin [Anopheles coluzzii]XP_040232861.2 hornerin [Anopheles coluzzii]